MRTHGNVREGVLIHELENDLLVLSLDVLHRGGVPVRGVAVLVVSPPDLSIGQKPIQKRNEKGRSEDEDPGLERWGNVQFG